MQPLNTCGQEPSSKLARGSYRSAWLSVHPRKTQLLLLSTTAVGSKLMASLCMQPVGSRVKEAFRSSVAVDATMSASMVSSSVVA